MGINYYGVLQISRESTDLEIKQAYRRLALEFNQKGLQDGDTMDAFALLAQAYDVLGDPLRKSVYDQFGEDGLKFGMSAPGRNIPAYVYHGDPMRTYREFFGTTSPFADLIDVLWNPPQQLQPGKVKQPPIVHPLPLSLHEVYFGGVKKMKILRLVYLNAGKSETGVREKILSIPITPGIRAKTEIKFLEEGDQISTHIPADVIFIVEDIPHKTFTRDGDNLIFNTVITLEEALLGCVITVETIDHRKLRIPITDVVGPSYKKIVDNEGLPNAEHPNQKGNLIIKFFVVFPESLPKASKQLLCKAFQLAKSNSEDN